MGSKRTFGEVDGSAQPEWSDQAGPAKKKYKKNKKHKAKPGSLNWVKKRARTIERRFQKDKDAIPANVQKDLERELVSHNRKINEEKDKKQRNKMIKKYHMVRFFERKKAGRLEKQLRQRLAETQDPEERAAIEADIHIAEVDRMYTIYFPYMERYVSLYPVSDLGLKSQGGSQPETQSSAALALHSQRPALWGTVEKAMEKGEEALERLRERRLGIDSRSKPPPPQTLSKHSFAAKARALQAKQEKQVDAPKRPLPTSNGKGTAGQSSDAGAKGKPRTRPGEAESSGDSDSSDDSEGGDFFVEG